MVFTKPLGLTQFQQNDKLNPLEDYNRDMRIINNTTASIASGVARVEEEAKGREDAIKKAIEVNTSSISAMSLKITDIETDVASNKADIRLNEQDIKNLQITTTSISSALQRHIVTSSSVETGIMKKIEENYTELKTKQFADEQRIEVNEQAIANHQEALDRLKGTSTEAGEIIADLGKDIEALQNADSTQAESIRDLRDKMQAQESASQTNANNIAALDNRVTVTEQNIEDLVGANIYKTTAEFNNRYAALINVPVNAILVIVEADITNFTSPEIYFNSAEETLVNVIVKITGGNTIDGTLELYTDYYTAISTLALSGIPKASVTATNLNKGNVVIYSHDYDDVRP